MSEVRNEFPFCPTTSLVLILDNGIQQRYVGNGRWQDMGFVASGRLSLYGVKSVSQDINEPGWRFDVEFLDAGMAGIAASKTGWDISQENNAVLFPQSSYSSEDPQVILTTHVTEYTRVLWRKWSIEMATRQPKWRSEEERQADMRAHERM